MPKPSVEFSIGVAVALALYLIDKADKSSVYVTLALLTISALLCLHAALSLPWIWTPGSLPVKVWRGGLLCTVVLLLIARFGIWVWPTTIPRVDEQTINKTRSLASAEAPIPTPARGSSERQKAPTADDIATALARRLHIQQPELAHPRVASPMLRLGWRPGRFQPDVFAIRVTNVTPETIYQFSLVLVGIKRWSERIGGFIVSADVELQGFQEVRLIYPDLRLFPDLDYAFPFLSVDATMKRLSVVAANRSPNKPGFEVTGPGLWQFLFRFTARSQTEDYNLCLRFTPGTEPVWLTTCSNVTAQ